ncbi:MAG: hypothetical protein R2722_15310 [Tessaracoccus sp.]
MGAAVMASLAVMLWLPPPDRAWRRRLDDTAATGNRWRNPLLGVGALVLALMLLLGGSWLAWWLVVVIAGGTVAWILHTRRRRRDALRAAEEVADGARVLSSLMTSGQIPGLALVEAAQDCGVLRFAAGIAALGGDVGEALNKSSVEPGRSQLGAVAAAWKLSERSGAPMAATLAGVADSLRHRQALISIIHTEPRSGPHQRSHHGVFALCGSGLGVLVGADPLSFLLRDQWGSLVVLVAVVLTAAGVLWTERLAASVEEAQS